MRWAGALALALVALAGCGADEESDSVLTDTANKLGDVRSGVLTFRLSAEATGKAGADGPVGFSLKGPFALPRDKGALPVADVQYSRFAGGKRDDTRVVSTGSRAFVTVGGIPYELGRAQERQLRSLGSGGGGDGLDALHVDRWVKGAKVGDGEAGTQRVSGRLDVVAAANDLLALSGGKRIGGEEAKQLERSVESSSVELVTGKENHILTRLVIRLKLGFDKAPERIRERLRGIGGAAFTLELGLSGANQPVKVTAPSGARPVGELKG